MMSEEKAVEFLKCLLLRSDVSLGEDCIIAVSIAIRIMEEKIADRNAKVTKV